ncbi:MAG: hypothetical protein QXW97_04450 [Candidatus Pacearchaeota archaeon]
MKYKIILFEFFILFSLVSLTGFVFAAQSKGYKNACLTYGESIPSIQNPRYTCKHDLCQVCVNSNNFPVHPSHCYDLPPCMPTPAECKNSGPLKLIVNSPLENFVFNSRKVNFSLNSDRLVTFYYKDNIFGRNRWSRLSSRSNSYQKILSFREGVNEITIKAVDERCNTETSLVRKFVVDSKKPKIGKTLVDYAGEYNIDFTEDNPALLLIKFGNQQKGYNSIPFNINNDCNKGTGGRYSCKMKINYEQHVSKLSNYNNEKIQVWFELYDIANNSIKSKSIDYFVDITPPVIENINSMFTINGKYVNFNIKINESNFKEVYFIDKSNINSKTIKLCTSLKNGYCTKKVSFNSGMHSLEIVILDKYQNPTINQIDFNII